MPVRNRNRNKFRSGYRVKNSDGSTQVRSIENFREVTEDVVGEGDNAFLDIDRWTYSGGLLNGRMPSMITGYEYFNWPLIGPAHGGGSGWYSHLNTTSQTDSTYASRTLARTNPSRASIEAVINGIELREIPSLIKDTADYRISKLYKYISPSKFRLLKRAAKLHLMWSFGIAPLISDLAKLPQFQDLVDQRIDELERLRTRGLRRTITLDRLSATDVALNEPIWTSNGTIRADRYKYTDVTIRGHVRWYAHPHLLTKSDDEMRALAKKVIAGLSIDFGTAYELIPWSWLVDYFTNLGSIVAASKNTVSASHSSVRIMRHTRTRSYSRNHTGSPTLSMTPGYCEHETKTRRLASPSLSAHLGLLEAPQLSILGSLSILKTIR